MRFLLRHRDKLPCSTDADDDLLCRRYRPVLEAEGFTWAPEHVAREFSMECVRAQPPRNHFGFHGAFNFGHVLDREGLYGRARLMINSPYVSKTGHIWNSFVQTYPEVVREIIQQGASNGTESHQAP